MRTLAMLLASLALASAADDVCPSPGRMAEQLFDEADARGELVEAGQIMSMVSGSDRRDEARGYYAARIGELDLGKARAEFAKRMLARFTPEEIARLHRFTFERCLPIRDKLRRAREALRPLRTALAIQCLTERRALGDFAIEEPPGNVPESRLRLAAELLARLPRAAKEPAETEGMLLESGLTHEQARTLAGRWEARLATAKLHALALNLTEDELRAYLTDLAEPGLATLVRREQMIADGIVLDRKAEPFAFSPGPR